MKDSAWWCAGVLVLSVSGCDRGYDAPGEMRDLREARKSSGEVVKRLEADLEEARANLESIQKELALARRGITDEVIEERADLAKALTKDRKGIQNDISKAEGEAEKYEENTKAAANLLKETTVPEAVEAQGHTSTSK